MKHLLFFMGAAIVLFSCTERPKKFTDGTEYRVISDGKGQIVQQGNFIEVEILKKYKDSVLYDSREIMPQFGMYDTAQFPPLFKEIFKGIRVGDSVYTRNLVDSIYKQGNLPPFEKKGEYETTTYKFLHVYTTKEQTDSAYNAWLPIARVRAAKKMNQQVLDEIKKNDAQMKSDDKILSDYIKAHSLTATKAPWGTYVVLTNPGTGDNISDTSVAVVKYTGKTLLDSVFDSNVDPKFGHLEPLMVDMSQIGTIIFGWTDGLRQMKKGSKGLLLIPSTLAYGKNGKDNIKPNENLLFEMEVTDVITPAQYQQKQMEQQAEQQKKMMEMQQQMQEKMKKDSAKKK